MFNLPASRDDTGITETTDFNLSTGRTQASAETNELGFSAKHGVVWNDYLEYRPRYPASFFKRLYQYHATKPGALFSIAHDVGAGCGVVSAHLARTFDHVVVSDPNDGYVNLAREMLSNNVGSIAGARDKYAYLKEPAERSTLESATVDLITCCECIHWTDTVASLQEFHRQLKRNGTLAICHYSVPKIKNNTAAQRTWMKLWTQHSRCATGHLYDRAFKLCNTAMDGLEFPEADWKSIKRLYFNSDGITSFAFNERVGESRVKEREKRIWHGVDEEWCAMRGITWFKGFFGTFMPKVPDPELEVLWDTLDKELKGVETRVEFPLVIVLATRS